VELPEAQPELQPPPEQQFELDTQQLVVVRLVPELADVGLRSRESTGLALALLESGLAEIRHVLPVVGGAAASPGLSDWSLEQAKPWVAHVQVHEAKTSLRVKVDLCDPNASCVEQSAEGTLVGLPQSMGPLYDALAHQLQHAPLPGAEETWDALLTRDPYALRVVGRAAASLYGLLPPVEPRWVGDRRRDPVARAVFLDPSLPLAQWLAGRRQMAQGFPGAAREAFTRAVLEGKRRVLFRADEAAATLAEGHDVEAVKAWDSMRREAPEDVRFIPGHIQALIKTKALKQALSLLDALPARYQL
jgi:hypothetical protein